MPDEADKPDTPQKFVLDASALIAYFNDEQGAGVVEQLIQQVEDNVVEIFVASVNLYELYYDATKRSSISKAEEIIGGVYELPITVVEKIDFGLMRYAALFKVKHRMSLADSIALGLARQLGAKVVSSDHHEFDMVAASGDAEFAWIR